MTFWFRIVVTTDKEIAPPSSNLLSQWVYWGYWQECGEGVPINLLGLFTRAWLRGVWLRGSCITKKATPTLELTGETAPCPSYRQLNWRISFPYDCLLFTVYSSSGEEACEFYNFSELCDSGKFPESHELPFLGILFSLLEVATQHTDLELTSKGQGPRPNLVNKVNFFS